MADQLIPLKLPPGYVNNGTDYQSKGRWFQGDRVRFFQGNIQPLGGWASRSLSGATMAGTPNAAVSWMPDIIGVAQAPILAIGTTAGLYAVNASNIVYDITPAGVTSAGTNANRIWHLDVFGSHLVAVASVKDDYTKNLGPYVWAGDTGALALLMSGAPVTPNSICVTPERFIFLIGGVDPNGEHAILNPTVPTPRTVFWPSQETEDDWSPTALNTAGDWNIVTEGVGVCGKRIRGATLIWTSTDLHAATYIGGQFIYRFDKVGSDCGIISPHAAIVKDAAAIWMGNSQFFTFDGFVTPIDCEVQDYVFGSFNRTYAHLVWALSNPAFGEVTWHYPSAAATSPDRYVTYNYREKHWTFGTMGRVAGISAQPPGAVPVMISSARVIYDHETGTAMDGVAPYIESGPSEIGNGDQTYSITKLIPDEDNLGDVLMTIFGRNAPTSAETTYGPFELRNVPANVRVKARQMRIRYTQFTAAALAAARALTNAATTAFHYVAGTSLAEATFTRATTASYATDSNTTTPETAPPTHSANWRIGVMRLGVTAGSRR